MILVILFITTALLYKKYCDIYDFRLQANKIGQEKAVFMRDIIKNRRVKMSKKT